MKAEEKDEGMESDDDSIEMDEETAPRKEIADEEVWISQSAFRFQKKIVQSSAI